MVLAALCRPEIVGSSGMVANQPSRAALKASTEELMSRSSFGSELNSLPPFTWREASLAARTAAGAVDGKGGIRTDNPLLAFC